MGCSSATASTFRGRTATEYDELDVTAAGYLKGGVELTARFRTPRSTNRVRWDQLHQDLFAVDAHGSYPQAETGMMAWDLDAVRGPRARSATLNLDEAARAYDRGAAEVDGATDRRRDLGRRRSRRRRRAADGSERAPRVGAACQSWSSGGAIGAVGAWDELLSIGDARRCGARAAEPAREREGGVEMSARASGILRDAPGLREAVDRRGQRRQVGARCGRHRRGSRSRRRSFTSFRGRRRAVAFTSSSLACAQRSWPRARAAPIGAEPDDRFRWSPVRWPPRRLVSGPRGAGSSAIRAGASKRTQGAVGLVEARDDRRGGAGGALPCGLVVALPRASAARGELASGATEGRCWSGERAWASKMAGTSRSRRPVARASSPASRASWPPRAPRSPPAAGFPARGGPAAAEIAGRAYPQRRRTVRRRRGPTVAHTASEVRRLARLRAPVSVHLGRRFAGKRLGQEGVDVWVSIDLAPDKRDYAMLCGRVRFRPPASPGPRTGRGITR